MGSGKFLEVPRVKTGGGSRSGGRSAPSSPEKTGLPPVVEKTDARRRLLGGLPSGWRSASGLDLLKKSLGKKD